MIIIIHINENSVPLILNMVTRSMETINLGHKADILDKHNAGQNRPHGGVGKETGVPKENPEKTLHTQVETEMNP